MICCAVCGKPIGFSYTPDLPTQCAACSTEAVVETAIAAVEPTPAPTEPVQVDGDPA